MSNRTHSSLKGTLSERVASAKADCERYYKTGGPTPEEIAAAPVLHAWTLHAGAAPGYYYLAGEVEGHPDIPDGPMTTSYVMWLPEDKPLARTVGRLYRLGDSLSKFLTTYE